MLPTVAYEHYQKMLGQRSDDDTEEEHEPTAAGGSSTNSHENQSTSLIESRKEEEKKLDELSAQMKEQLVKDFKVLFAVADSTCCSRETGVTVRMPVKNKKIIELDINSMALYFNERELILYAFLYNHVQEFENDQDYFYDGEALNFMRRLIGGYVHYAFRSQQTQMNPENRQHFVLSDDGGDVIEYNKKISKEIRSELTAKQTASLFKISRGAIMDQLKISTTLFVFEYKVNKILQRLAVKDDQLKWLSMPAKFKQMDEKFGSRGRIEDHEGIAVISSEQLRAQKIYKSIRQIESEERKAGRRKPRGTPTAFWYYQPRENKFKCLIEKKK